MLPELLRAHRKQTLGARARLRSLRCAATAARGAGARRAILRADRLMGNTDLVFLGQNLKLGVCQMFAKMISP